MLLPDNIRPENSIYYNGATILDLLLKHNNINLTDLYVIAKQEHGISFPMLILCLDWLYLLNAVVLNESGKVNLCS